MYAKLDVPYDQTVMGANLFSEDISNESSGIFSKTREVTRYSSPEVFYNPVPGTKENKLFFRRSYEVWEQKGKGVGSWMSWKDNKILRTGYEYTELNLDDLANLNEDQTLRAILGHVFFAFDISRDFTIAGINLQQIIYDKIKNPIPVDEEPVIENILNQYKYANNQYTLDLNVQVLAQEGRFHNSMPITLTRSPITSSGDYNTFTGDISPYALSRVTFRASLLDEFVILSADLSLANFQNGTFVALEKNAQGYLKESFAWWDELGTDKTSVYQGYANSW